MEENSWLPALTVTNLLVATVVGFLAYILRYYFFPNFPGIPGPTPLPIVGNMITFIKKGALLDKELVKKYGKVYRLYEGDKEALVVSDVDMLKHIMVKDFGDFRNRRYRLMVGIFKAGLFDAVDETWVRLRHLLTPSFTSGKLKQILPMVNTCGQRLLTNIEKQMEAKGEFEAKKLAGAYTMDVIACSAFGIEIDSLQDENSPFISNAMRLFTISFRNWRMFLNVVLTFCCPPLGNLLDKFDFFGGDIEAIDFFRRLLEKTIKERQEQKTERVDFLQLMLNAGKQELDQEGKEDLAGLGQLDESDTAKGFTPDEILAQALLFFLAAYETTSTTIAFLIYNLAQNQEAQERLYQEIKSVMVNYKEANYEAISKMEYMEQCIQETLRMFPPVLRMDRKSGVDMEYNGIRIPKGTIINIPILAMHHDPEVFPDPEKFDPERFTPEARQSRSQFYHLPFGLGPRQCIGMRLALMEIKLAFVKLLTKFKFMPGSKPPDIELRFIPTTKSGIWIRAESR